MRAFDTLRDSRPGDLQQINLLEQAVVSMLQEDPESVVDDRYLNQTLRLERRFVHQALLTLVAKGLLAVKAFWLCPNGYGTTKEADHVREFPSVVSCPRCGQEHWLSEANIQLHFVATQRLLDELQQPPR